MDPFIGEIKLVPYTFAPVGWAFCDGSLLQISTNTALFSLLGTTYGGDGVNTFALPDMRGQVAFAMGQSTAGSNYVLGQFGGVPQVTLTVPQIPSHVHNINVQSGPAGTSVPTGQYLAVADAGVANVYTASTKETGLTAPLNPNTGGVPHDNLQPYLALNYVIALEGIFPPHN